MIRIIIFLLAVGIVALGIAWLADRPGEVTVQWMGLQIETSVMVAAFAVLTTTALLLFLWTVRYAMANRGSIITMPAPNKAPNCRRVILPCASNSSNSFSE